MNITEQLFLENQLIKIGVPSGWLIVKNYLFDVNLAWLNQQKIIDYDEYFILVDIFFTYQVFYAKFNAHEPLIANKYSEINLSVYANPIIENDEIQYIDYEVSLSFIGKKSRRNGVAYQIYSRNFIDLENVANAISQAMALVAFYNRETQSWDFEKIKMVLDYQIPD